MPSLLTTPAKFKVPPLDDLLQELMKVGYYAQRDDVNAIRWLLHLPAESGVKALLLRGLPGVGKTFLCEAVAKFTGMEYLFMLCNAWDSTEQMFRSINVAAAVKGDHENVDCPGILTMAALMSQQGKKVIVVFDEIDKTEDRAQNLTLDFLQYARAQWEPGSYVQGDPANIYFIATSNDMKPLSGALMRRFRDYEMKPLPLKLQVAIISKNLGIDKNVVGGIIVKAHELAKTVRRDLSLQELSNLVQEVVFCGECSHDTVAMITAWVSRSHRFSNESKIAGEKLHAEVKEYKDTGVIPSTWSIA